MQLPTEVVQAEILDWWEGERERIAQIMPDRMPALFYNVDKVIDDMSVADFLKRGRFVANKVEPLVADWIERTYKELTHEIDESFRASAYKTEGGDAYQKWSYGDMATAGAAIAVSAAPVAGIPFFAGGDDNCWNGRTMVYYWRWKFDTGSGCSISWKRCSVSCWPRRTFESNNAAKVQAKSISA